MSHTRGRTQSFRERLAALARVLVAEVDWDEGAGELWARLITGGQVAAALSVRGPILFVREASVPGELALTVVRVPAMDAAVLSCDKAVLQRFFAQDLFTEQFDHTRFSFDDLYYEKAT